MIFDQNWITELLELQKKAAELYQGRNSTAEVHNLVAELLNKWGINNMPWNADSETGKSFWSNVAPAAQTGPGFNIDISETKDEILIQALIPGIEDINDLLVKVCGDSLYITGKSSNSENNDGTFNRKVQLPGKVTAKGAQATYRNDNLTITLPKLNTMDEETIPLSFFTASKSN